VYRPDPVRPPDPVELPAPVPGGAGPETGVRANQTPFDPLVWPARIVVGLLAATIALDIAAVVLDVRYHDLVARLNRFDLSALGPAEDAQTLQGDMAVAEVALLVITAIFFLVWFHRAYKNLGALGVARLRWSTEWAVIWWFVPFLNFVRPKQIADDTWRGSGPEQPAIPWYHTLWWLAFVAGGVLSRVAERYDRSAETLPSMLTAANLATAADALDIVAAGLAIAVVSATTRRQRRRAAMLAAEG
jgi:hypothetical protein